MIVIAASVIVAVSLLGAPGRGVISAYRERGMRHRMFRKRLALADHHSGRQAT
jgi:hypothetical protein